MTSKWLETTGNQLLYVDLHLNQHEIRFLKIECIFSNIAYNVNLNKYLPFLAEAPSVPA